jgi:PhnB protein
MSIWVPTERISELSYIPEDRGAVMPYLIVPDGDAAIQFYRQVFGAAELFRHADDSGRVLHARLDVGGSIVELGEHHDVATLPPDRPAPVAVHLYVPDVDGVYDRAVEAGAQGEPPQDQFYGDREVTLRDPFGIAWYVATHLGTPA